MLESIPLGDHPGAHGSLSLLHLFRVAAALTILRDTTVVAKVFV